MFQLDGSASAETDGTITSYYWYQVRGPLVSLESTNTAITSFEAPANAELEFVFRLVSDTGEIATDRIVIRVEPYTNQSPIANAGVDQTVTAGNTVQLDGSASTDPDGTIVRYNWYQQRGPSVVIENRQTATPSFEMPANAEVAFGLQVFDNAGAVTSDRVLIRTDINTNQAPVANAGVDQTVTAGNTVQLDGSASTDPDGTIVKYNWYQQRGPTVVIENRQTATPSFEMPANAEVAFGLQVFDNAGAVTSDRVLIRTDINTNQAPIAVAGDDRTVSMGAWVSLDGSASTDTDGNIARYIWWQRSGPSVQLTDRNTAAPGFEASTLGDVVLRLRVEDDRGARAVDDINISVVDDGNQPPIADAGPDATHLETRSHQ
ncbi:MAG: PKD domain-containing protein, partial [Candidatus Thiodiazotropha sp. (ex Lucinoma kastoroae)]|nr:PKD domain-containing protein [Candidatus Thiodiazotropha sp. (ex Lucinoma kastoroae)]